MALTTGQLLQGRYLIEQQIGQGGFAAVYRAFDQVLARLCAIKENLATDPAAVQQFAQEAQILARLHHPNLPRVIDHFLLRGQGQYLVMDYIEGQNLAQIIAQPMPVAQALPIIEQVCQALEYLHSQDPPVIHRDVKPQNVIITPTGRVVLVDFGIAKLYRADLPTRTVARAFTPGYAAPEQYGSAPTDPRSDVYAVGATLYTLLTGHQPPDALDRLANQAPVPAVRAVNPTVSAGLEQAVFKALDLSTHQRFASIGALRHGLQRGIIGHTWIVRQVASLLALVVLLLLLFWWLDGRRNQENDSLTPGTVPGATLAGTALPSDKLHPTFTPTLVVVAPSPTANSLLVAAVVTVTLSAPSPTPLPSPTPQPTASPTSEPPTPTPFGGGGQIAFVSERDGNPEIYIMRSDGSGLLRLTNHPGADRVFSWSPDGQQVALEAERDGNWDLYISQHDGSGLTRLTTDPAEERTPRWSPDGSQMLYHSNVGDGVWRLWVMGGDGSNPAPVTNDPVGDWAGAWSPDGQQVVFAHNFLGPAEIFIANRDGTNLRNLTNSQAHESAPVWSPDGQAIAFYSERDGNREIYVMNPDGSEQTRLTNNPAKDYLAAWSPDSQHLLFTSDRDGNQEIYLMQRDGSDVRRLTDHPAHDYNAIWSVR